MIQNAYDVAGIRFAVNLPDSFAEVADALLDNYVPFALAKDEPTTKFVFEMGVERQEQRVEFVEDTRQEDEGQSIVCGSNALGEYVFEFYLGDCLTGTLVCAKGFYEAKILLAEVSPKFALNNSLMIMFALATSNMGVALFHSAVVACENCGYMFLGKSGTGKSTHARLWLAHVDGAELLNDDNPVVRLQPDGAWVYGSPWSGKTPCYRNKGVRLGAIVNLSQAPYNKIRPIVGVEAYIALLSSISGMRWNKEMADGLHNTENELAKNAKMFHLECLPDEEAAKLCYGTVTALVDPDKGNLQ